MGAMTAAMRDALELIRSLKKQYPDETEDQLVSRFQKELEGDRALKRAVMREVFNDLLQEARCDRAAVTYPELNGRVRGAEHTVDSLTPPHAWG
jgi:2-polyprenyl-6-methoxyphenol hydroxylase-like FAD-dependent oxidoreductase